LRNSTENNTLLSAITVLSKTVEKESALLMHTTSSMSLKLDEFIQLQKSHEDITYQNVADSLGEALKKAAELGTAFDAICTRIDRSLSGLIEITKMNKVDINAINKNAALLSEIKELFTAYKSDALSAEISHLQQVTNTLKNNISTVFALIEETIKRNASGLSASYEKFFETCKRFTDSISENQDSKTTAALQALNDNFLQKTAAVNEQALLLENAIKETSNSTRTLCESVYDFTQFTLSPTFMEKIRNHINFSQKLKDASAKLLSYDKLIEEYERNYDVPVQKKLEGIDKTQKELADKLKAFQGIADIGKRLVNLEECVKQIEGENAEKTKNDTRDNLKNDDSSVYYISFDFSSSGPYNLKQLIKKIKRNEITKKYYVTKNNSGWTRILMLPELSSYFSGE
jgi:hypothetical protein